MQCNAMVLSVMLVCINHIDCSLGQFSHIASIEKLYLGISWMNAFLHIIVSFKSHKMSNQKLKEMNNVHQIHCYLSEVVSQA